MIKYLGSKRALLSLVTEAIQSIPEAVTVLDLFSGTSRVGHALKGLGYRVVANDHNTYAHTLAQCYVAADREDVARDVELLIRELSGLKGYRGYFTKTFCEDSLFFQPKNGRKVDAIRDAIEKKDLPPDLKSVMLVSLMEAADRVDSTCGVQMAYLKKWASRSYNDISLRMPDCLPRATNGKGQAFKMEASVASRTLEADVVYVDPPYNQHSYLGNYHIWETLVLWDHPETYGRACKRVDCRQRKSPFNSKRKFRAALQDVIANVRTKTIVVSFNNEGYISRPELEEILGQRGRVSTSAHPYKRYVGAQIGVYNPQGEKVGKVSHLRNVENLYVVDVDQEASRCMGLQSPEGRPRYSPPASS